MAAGHQEQPAHIVDPHLTDPQLLRDNSEFKSYRTSRFEYPEIRVFFREHARAAELYRSNGPLPLMVFIPGLGGSVAQFNPLLGSLVDLSPCLAIDYPGGGRSGFAPKDWAAYSFDALNELFETIIEDYRDKEAGQTVILIGHSMGTARAACLANPTIKHTTSIADYVVGIVAICPISGLPSQKRVKQGRLLMWVPGWIVNLWRAWDGRGGPESASVSRFVGPEAEPELKTLQYRFNKQSRTPVWRRMLYGLLPKYVKGEPVGGMTGLDVWAGLDVPVYLIAAENDGQTSPEEVDKIVEAMRAADENVSVCYGLAQNRGPTDAASSSRQEQSGSNGGITQITDADFARSKKRNSGSPSRLPMEPDNSWDVPSTPQETSTAVPSQPRHPRKVIRTMLIPAPATHAVLYTPRCVRVLAGLVSDFLASSVTGRLSLGWQLQYLSREGKWDVKNLNKWKAVNPVSDPIGPAGKPIFRAMKTLREADDVHCPAEFTAKWAGTITDVVDISKDQPVYDPRGLERAGVAYHKFPTVSKVPPQAADVEAFIRLVDSVRRRKAEAGDEGLIGVHCHYGFNRTGYFIVCYLVERCGMGVREAIEEFAVKRPNGIRHSHFRDRLYVRYDVEA